jgi:hypothetical protein
LQNHPCLNPNTFYKNNPRFFCNYKNTLFICTFKFSKASHKHTQALHLTNTYFTLTKYMPSITNTRTVTSSPPKKNLVPRFGRKALMGREANHPSKVTENKHTREDWGWWREHEEIVHRWVWQDKRVKGDQVLVELRPSRNDNKCRRHSSQSSWITNEDNARGG